MTDNRIGAAVLGGFLFLGMVGGGYLVADAIIKFRSFERSITVKGLSEREYDADIVIWPIQFSVASNELGELYQAIDDGSSAIRRFLLGNGIAENEITLAAPSITDKSAQQYGNGNRPEFRYTAMQSVTVYSRNIDAVRGVMGRLSELGKQGIVLTGGGYQAQEEYLFTRLNEVKPAMIEDATRNAREVANKFAADSQSRLGKIKRASQGQFSIQDRDRNNPHIKKIRVVSTIEYYLSD
jgi:hypothetical protein